MKIKVYIKINDNSTIVKLVSVLLEASGWEVQIVRFEWIPGELAAFQNDYKTCFTKKIINRRLYMKKFIAILLCTVLLFSIAISASGLASVQITGLKADKASVTLVQGASYALKITLTPANTTQKLLTFTTTNNNVASIDAQGKITAVGAGKAVITIASKSNANVSAKVNVTVNKKKNVVLRVEVYDRGNAGGSPADNNYWTKWIQANYGDKNNVTLKYETSPRFDNDAKLQMWMAAGTAPDLCYTYSVDVVANYFKNGGLTDLNPALNQYGAELKEFLGEYLLAKGVDVKSGVRYDLAARRAVDANEATWIRQDWLDKLKLPMPATKDEWYNTMKAFKEKNPDKVGKIVPFSLTFDVGWGAANILEAYKTDKSDMTRYIVNGRYLQIFAPGVKDGIKFLNKMYNEGLISKEFALDTQSNIQNADVISGFAGCFTGNYDWALRAPSPGLLTNLQAKRPDAKLVPCDPFTDKDGVTTKKLIDTAGIFMFVPKTSESKVGEAIKYLNWMCDPDVMFFLQYGEEGKNHTMVNGVPQVIAAKGETIQNSANNCDLTMVVNGVIGKTKTDTINRNSLVYTGAYQSLYVQAFQLATVNGYVPPEAKINETPAADSKYGNAIVTKANEFYAKTISCKPADFESVWSTMSASLLRAGASDMMAERKALWLKYFPKK
jgi:putative aldouronate transport system substrate-binding protein